MDPKLTFALAAWGAVVSTVGICWQVFQWVRAHPRIAVRAVAYESPTGDEADDYVRFELRNRGGRATTIEEIMFVSYESWFARLRRDPNRIEYLSAYKTETLKLPVLLQSGELWRGTCYLGPRNDPPHLDQTRRERFVAGKLTYRIRCAHTDRLIAGIVQPEEFMRG